MGLIHAPNTTPWQCGDLVIHDADAKRIDMLMIVVSCSAEGVYRTRYVYPWAQPRAWRRKFWQNTIASLHDPARFGINVPRLALNAAVPASVPSPPPSAPPQCGPTARS
ncbi:MAG: hypothetical protein AB7S86_12130 [Hydrogenophaga sp.]|uniref:hypothetical protein n=1 Tax=Hydrogenophaga sp. TaxID=1904254 RepID=UPI003D11810B